MYIEQKFNDAKVAEDGLIYFDNALQALCRYDVKENCVSIMAEYNGDFFSAFKLFDLCDVMYFTTSRNADVLKYDKERKLFLKFTYNLPENSHKTMSQMYLRDNKIYMLAHYAVEQPLICFDISSETYESKYFLHDGIRQEEAWFPFAYAYNGRFWAVNHGTPDYYCIDPNEEEIWKYSLKRTEKLHSICKYGERLLAATVDSKVISICENGDFETLWTGKDVEAYSYMVELKDYIAVLPRYGNEILLCDKSTYSFHCISIDWDEAKDSGGNASRCLFCRENDKTIFVLPNRMSRMFAVDKLSLKISAVNPEFDVSIEARCYHQKYGGRIQQEGEALNLEEFCRMVSVLPRYSKDVGDGITNGN